MKRTSEAGMLRTLEECISHLDVIRNIDWPSAEVRFSAKGNLTITYADGEIIYDPQTCTIRTSAIKQAKSTTDRQRLNWAAKEMVLQQVNQTLESENFLSGMACGGFLESAHVKISDVWVVLHLEYKEGSPITADGDCRLARMDEEISAEGILKKIREGKYEKKLAVWKLQEILSAMQREGAAFEKELRDTGIFSTEPSTENFSEQDLEKLKMVREGKYASPNQQSIIVENNKDGYINITRGFMVYNYRTNTDTIADTTKAKRDAFVKKCSVYAKHYPKYKEFRDDMKTRFGNLGLKPQMRMTISGDEAKFCVQVSYAGTQVNEQISSKALKKDRDAIVKKAKAMVKADKKDKEARQKTVEDTYAKDPFYGDYLAGSIVKLVEANDGIKYGEIVKVLIGKPIGSNGQLKTAGEYGKYALIDHTEVNNGVMHCVSAKLIKEVMVKNSSGHQCKVLVPVKSNIDSRMRMDTPVNFGKNKKYAEYRDNDWGAFLDATKPSDISNNSYWKKLLPLLDHVNVYCEKKEKFTAFFSGAPENVKEYIRVSRTLADGVKRRMLEELVERMDGR